MSDFHLPRQYVSGKFEFKVKKFCKVIICSFLGILLEFRRSIADDDFLHRCLQRSNLIIKSLGILMDNLDNEFFNCVCV